MGEFSYKRGASAGRSGSDPSPPKHGLFDSLTGVGEKEVKEWARDYERGYEAGSQQRLADEIKRDGDK
ncbi:MAG TPA: hypothetical protein VN048_12050 [Verrucomicrobiae bacterium]|nr:hypothetical protein [Verrucomicrobiae bacterium]